VGGAEKGASEMTVKGRLRFEILRRDGHTCRYCGQSAPDVRLTVDHVVPESLGGADDPANLVTACTSCNAGKASIAPDSALVDDVAADALRYSRALALAIEEPFPPA
jgi:5-methylcytosine-specific restriction endonuclease McrA